MRSVRDRAWPEEASPAEPSRAEPACARALSAPSPSRPRDPVLKPRAPFCLRAKKEGKEQSRANFPLLSLSRKESERKTTSVDYLRRRRERLGGQAAVAGRRVVPASGGRLAVRRPSWPYLPTYRLPSGTQAEHQSLASESNHRPHTSSSRFFLHRAGLEGGAGGCSTQSRNDMDATSQFLSLGICLTITTTI